MSSIGGGPAPPRRSRRVTKRSIVRTIRLKLHGYEMFAPGALIASVDRVELAWDALQTSCAVVLERFFDDARCAAWVEGVYAGRDVWTRDFGGEQFSLGRAFYTHLEEGNSGAYFTDVSGSDARVESCAPGLQDAMRALVADVVGARAVPRRGWCGPGVHVFPPGGPVASRGGVRHFDTEGLPARHAAAHLPAITLVAMLQTPERDGGLRVWDVLYEGHDHPTREEIARASATVTYRTGDVVLIDSYRLHQIQPFDGGRDRISATVHAAKVDRDLWECWF